MQGERQKAASDTGFATASARLLAGPVAKWYRRNMVLLATGLTIMLVCCAAVVAEALFAIQIHYRTVARLPESIVQASTLFSQYAEYLCAFLAVYFAFSRIDVTRPGVEFIGSRTNAGFFSMIRKHVILSAFVPVLMMLLPLAVTRAIWFDSFLKLGLTGLYSGLDTWLLLTEAIIKICLLTVGIAAAALHFPRMAIQWKLMLVLLAMWAIPIIYQILIRFVIRDLILPWDVLPSKSTELIFSAVRITYFILCTILLSLLIVRPRRDFIEQLDKRNQN